MGVAKLENLDALLLKLDKLFMSHNLSHDIFHLSSSSHSERRCLGLMHIADCRSVHLRDRRSSVRPPAVRVLLLLSDDDGGGGGGDRRRGWQRRYSEVRFG